LNEDSRTESIPEVAEDPLEPSGLPGISWGSDFSCVNSGTPAQMPLRRGLPTFSLLFLFVFPVLVFGLFSEVLAGAETELLQDPADESAVITGKWSETRGDLHDAQTERCIRRGIHYLVQKQNGVGAFSATYPVAVTALSGLALLGAGAEFGSGPDGQALEKAVDYLISPIRSNDRGYLEDRGESRSRMHGHSYAILFLSQVIGQVPTPQREEQIRKVIRAGVKLILSCQTKLGGWGYDPSDPLDEASLTVCCLQALRSAKEAGVHVPKETIDRALEYLRQCATEEGTFRYSLTRSRSRTSYEITAASISTMDAAGEYSLEERKRGMDYIRRLVEKGARTRKGAFHVAGNFPYYGNFYTGQILQQSRGELWEVWSRSVWPQLLKLQKETGSWESRYGEEYATAMALLILELPMGYLPLYDR
jgi:hypothetical protein